MDRPKGSGTASFLLSVVIGAYVGICIQMAIQTFSEPVNNSELWAIPVIIAAYGALTFPFVAVGLALFGLPATKLLRRRAQAWWVGPVAALWGIIAGKLMFYAIDHLMFLGLYKFWDFSKPDVGIIYGLPTGIAWWLLERRELQDANVH